MLDFQKVLACVKSKAPFRNQAEDLACLKITEQTQKKLAGKKKKSDLSISSPIYYSPMELLFKIQLQNVIFPMIYKHLKEKFSMKTFQMTQPLMGNNPSLERKPWTSTHINIPALDANKTK